MMMTMWRIVRNELSEMGVELAVVVIRAIDALYDGHLPVQRT